MNELNKDMNCEEVFEKIEPVSEANKIFDLISQLNTASLKENRPISKIPRFGVLLKQEKTKHKEDSSTNSLSSQTVSSEDTSINRPSRIDRTENSQKRRVSMSNSSSLLNKTRSLSTQPSTDNLSIFSDKSDKKIRYLVKHKPRSSQVKIFSQKLELKNVKSKINSLEKANYVPGGGNVVIQAQPVNWEAKSKIGSFEKYNYEPGGGQVAIESKPCNWEAKPRIGSLEKASYVPSGGNVKITNYKLNWQAKSKIGSLERANHTPLGGNVKIPSFKVDFREKAKPKTDTGLIIIEDFDENLSFSSDLINESLQSFTDSN